DDEDAGAGHAGSGARGRRSQTHAPPLARLRAPTEPPCSSTIRLAIASPSPVPSGRVLKNGEKARASASGLKPGPLAVTSITAQGGSGAQPTTTRPDLAAACTALWTRLSSTCCI